MRAGCTGTQAGLVTLSQASQALALTRLPEQQVDGVPLVHRAVGLRSTC